MQKVLKQSKLDIKSCERIWDVVNPNYDTTFSKTQYYLCMALIAKVREGVSVPSEIPAELVQSAMEAADPVSAPSSKQQKEFKAVPARSKPQESAAAAKQSSAQSNNLLEAMADFKAPEFKPQPGQSALPNSSKEQLRAILESM